MVSFVRVVASVGERQEGVLTKMLNHQGDWSVHLSALWAGVGTRCSPERGREQQT